MKQKFGLINLFYSEMLRDHVNDQYMDGRDGKVPSLAARIATLALPGNRIMQQHSNYLLL